MPRTRSQAAKPPNEEPEEQPEPVGAPTTDEDEVGEPANDEEEKSESKSGLEDFEDEDIEDPSEDIRSDLFDIITGNVSEFKGDFASLHSYSSAPNTGLSVEGVGSIGLPLNEVSAKALIKACSRAPYGKGKKTLVDKSVRDTLQIEPTKVSFLNPKWADWVDNTIVPQVCAALGVDVDIAKPKAELYKLLLYQTGSHFLPHQDTKKAPGMFGTIVIILPSLFDGGQLCLEHAGKRKLVDVAPKAAYTTNIVAWYTDVFHSVQPVKSGFRLALSYNLIHCNAPSLKPVPPDKNPQSLQLRHVLLSWKQEGDPTKLIYLFDHMYNEDNLKTASLKGKDAHVVRNLRGIAESLGFRICLVNLELHECGQAEDYGGSVDYYEEYDSEHEYISPQRSMEMIEVNESNWSVSNPVDLDGNEMELNSDIDFDDESEYLTDRLKDGKPSEKEYEGYQGNHGGDVNVWYRRTALVIWPAKYDFDMIIEDVGEYAEDQLGNLEEPTMEANLVVSRLAQWGRCHVDSEYRETVAEVLFEAAMRWKKCRLWLDICDAFGAYRYIHIVDASRIVEAVEIFGLEPLKPFIERAIRLGRRDFDRFVLTSSLLVLAKRTKQEEMSKWATTLRSRIFHSLHDADTRSIPHLMRYAKRKGCVVLQEKIIPQLKAHKANSQYWMAFVAALKVRQDAIQPSSQQVNELIGSLTALSLSEHITFPTSARAGSIRCQSTLNLPSIDKWLKPLMHGLDVHSGAARDFFGRMKRDWDSFPDHERKYVANNFLKPVIARLDAYSTRRDPKIMPGDEGLLSFWSIALSGAFEYMDHCQAEVQLALRRYGGFERAKDQLSPIVQKLCTTWPQRMQLISRDLFNSGSQIKATDKFEAFSMRSFVDHILQNLAEVAPLGSQESYRRNDTDIQAPYTLFQLFLQCDSQISLEKLLQRLLDSTPNPPTYSFYEGFLIPFASACIRYLVDDSRPWPSQPLAKFVRTVVWQLVHLVGPPPPIVLSPQQLTSTGCGCRDCDPLRAFALSGTHSIQMPASQKVRTHLEQRLQMFGVHWGFTWTTVRTGSPHSLQVTKPAPLVAQNLWSHRSENAQQLLQTLGEMRILKAILADRWLQIFWLLSLNDPVLPVPLVVIPPVVPLSRSSIVKPATKEDPGTPPTSNTAASNSHAELRAPSGKRTMEEVDPSNAQGSRTHTHKRSKPSVDVIELSD